MDTRASIQDLIRRSGQKIVRFRTWTKANDSRATGLLCEKSPSGYANWFAVEKERAIWWIYSDASDGGEWSMEGITVVGYRIEYEECIANSIYRLVYQSMMKTDTQHATR